MATAAQRARPGWPLTAAALVMALVGAWPSVALAQQPTVLFVPELRLLDSAALKLDPVLEPMAAEPPEQPPRYRKNYLVPLLEEPAAALVLNITDRLLKKDYAETHGLNTFWHNLAHEPWAFDDDDLRANFIAHPYNGSIYFNLARSMGLNYWESTAYTAFGSALFELGGETQAPSINDEIITITGGSFAGEILHRSSVRILEGGDGAPGFWRYVPVFFLDTPLVFNRLVFGEHRSPEYDERTPLFFMALGGGGFNWTNNPDAGGNSHGLGGGGFFDYRFGQPGSPEFSPRRPFDYFRVTASLTADHQALRDAFTLEGLLGGWKIDQTTFHGVGGFFGSYDNISGGTFRYAGAALGVGVVGQFTFTDRFAVESIATVSGIAMGSADTTVNVPPHVFHQGPGAKAALDLRLFCGERTLVTIQGDHDLVFGVNGDPGRDDISFLEGSASVRIVGPLVAGVGATFAARRETRPDLPIIEQQVITPLVTVGWVSDPRFGAWVPGSEQR